MKIKFLIPLVLLLTVIIIINSCENKEGAVPLIVSVPNSCDTTKLTYSSGSNTMLTIINVQCGANNTSCHSAGSISGYDYSTYKGVYSNYQNGLLYNALFGSFSNMPKVAQSGWDPSCMMPKFRAWINQGCPQ